MCLPSQIRCCQDDNVSVALIQVSALAWFGNINSVGLSAALLCVDRKKVRVWPEGAQLWELNWPYIWISFSNTAEDAVRVNKSAFMQQT